jgi:hypothetical protein
MQELIFPDNNGQIFYTVYHQYMLDIFSHISDVKIVLQSMKEQHPVYWTCYLNGKEFIICGSDANDRFEGDYHSPLNNITNIPIFKFHYGRQCKFNSNVFPFAPTSFHNWDKTYYRFKDDIRYKANNDLILNKQFPSGDALIRRNVVQDILKIAYGKKVDLKHNDDQIIFWHKINNCLVSVCVPGFTNNMLDRGQLQYMAFGCCTISPMLPEILPYDLRLEPNEHYILCENDYSDLLEKIEYCKRYRDKCVAIGNRAKTIFMNSCTPQKLFNWIMDKL